MMKRVFIIALLVLASMQMLAQQCYWVFLADKQGTQFDPYTYFDAKAIERYQQCGADLYDITNYPLNGSYVNQVNALATEEVGTSRWMNAMAVMATQDQIAAIEALPFVLRTQQLQANMQLAQASVSVEQVEKMIDNNLELTDQLIRMQGAQFRDNGIDGKGIRIAVFDGGFPRVNTHQAFKHLRDNNRIIDTWNFPDKKADVYGWNSHGLMTLSCITGKVGNKQLGLATGSEFMLYRTEINPESFKEEVWWQMAMERADKHGANIISSSLGYGKERYFTEDMDGTSYVAKAGNMAARKGMLVVNSAGNEADSKQWKTIITPADAEYVLCVGGIEANLNKYHHISFSSFGPSADGRLKPNVAAFGYALAASNRNDDDIHEVDGTSFSCPLVSGFAACAWQVMKGKTAMEMFDLIQQSADLYPYYDYAMGYGVPQASFFMDKEANEKMKNTPTFKFVESQDSVSICPLVFDVEKTVPIFYNKQRPSGMLECYINEEMYDPSLSGCIRFHKGGLDSCTLNVWYYGYTASYRLSDADRLRMKWEPRKFYGELKLAEEDQESYISTDYYRTPEDLIPSQSGSNARWRFDYGFLQFGDMVNVPVNDKFSYWSPTFHAGFRVMCALSKAYCWGVGIEYGSARYNLNKAVGLDNMLIPGQEDISKRQFKAKEVALELFQRIRLVPGGIFGKGTYMDLGVYGSRAWGRYDVKMNQYAHTSGAAFSFKNPSFIDNYTWNYGVAARLAYNVVGIYARYRLSGLGVSYDVDPENPEAFQMNLPRLEVGLQLAF